MNDVGFSNTPDVVRTMGIPIVVVMNAVALADREAREASEAIAGLMVDACRVRLANRMAISSSIIADQTAQEFEPGGKAAVEAAQLHEFMCAHLHT